MNALTLKLPSSLDRRQSEGWLKVSQEMIQPEHTLIEIDFSQTQSIDASGVAALLKIKNNIANPDATICLQNPNNEIIQTIEIMGMNRVFQISTSPESRESRPIVIVEDDIVIRNLANMVLQPLGMPIISVEDGIEALRIIDQEKPGLILLDYVLPIVNGAKIVGHLKETKETRDIPIIVMSAHPRLAQGDLSQTPGASAFLSKPFKVEEMRRIASQLILMHQAANN